MRILAGSVTSLSDGDTPQMVSEVVRQFKAGVGKLFMMEGRMGLQRACRGPDQYKSHKLTVNTLNIASDTP